MKKFPMEPIFLQLKKNPKSNLPNSTADVIESSEKIGRDWFEKGIPQQPTKDEQSKKKESDKKSQ